LENPRDRGAWWAAIYGVPKSQTRLKRLSSSRQQQQQGEGRKEQRNISTNYFWDTVFTGKFLAMKYIRKKSLDLITSASTLRNQNKNKLSPK